MSDTSAWSDEESEGVGGFYQSKHRSVTVTVCDDGSYEILLGRLDGGEYAEGLLTVTGREFRMIIQAAMAVLR